MAASAPLLPAFTPARSMACSTVSQVSTPKLTAHGAVERDLSDALAHLAGHVLEVRCAAADDAAQRDDARVLPALGDPARPAPRARRCPGTRKTSMSPSATPWRTSASWAPLEQLLGDEAVEARHAEREPPLRRS